MSDVLLVLGLAFVILFVYFLPSIVALRRGSSNAFIVIILNYFFGLTLIGWCIALALAISGETQDERVMRYSAYRRMSGF